MLAWFGAGHLILRVSTRVTGDERRLRVLDTARATAFGAGAWSLLWFALGVAGLYTIPVAVVALVVGVALAGMAVVSDRRRGAPASTLCPSTLSAALTVAMVVVAVPLVAAFVASLAPPTAKDALQYHIALPKAFLTADALVVVPYNIASFFPLGAEMNGLWAMLLGRAVDVRIGEAAFGAVAFAFFPLLLAVVYGWARERGMDRTWAATSAALVATVPTAYEVAASGYVDLALSVYVALAVNASARWWATLQSRHLVHLALALAFALSIKVLALFPLLLVAAVVLLRSARGAASGASLAVIGTGLRAVGAGLALGSPWYLRTWVHTGSPVFPFLLDVWPGAAAGWDTARSVMLRGFNAQYGAADALSFVLTPILVSVTGWREMPALYEGVLGIAFLVGTPIVVLALRRRLLDVELALAAGMAGCMFVWWSLSAQVLRYLLPALPPLAVAIAGAGAGLSRAAGDRNLRWALLTPAAAGLALTVAWFVADAPFLAVLGSEGRAEYLARRLDYYPYYRVVNETLPPEARVWLINMRRDTYHLERPYFSDYLFEDYTLRQWVEHAITPAELRARAREAGITHVLVRHDVLLDYARSSIVVESRSREDNLVKLALVRSFLGDGTRILAGDAKFVLAALPALP